MRNTKMSETDIVSSYLTKITQTRDDLAAGGETIDSEELVRSTLSRFPLKWDVFVDGSWHRKIYLVGVDFW